jgi:DNA-binding MarR family transcriptional regulator
MTNTRKYQTGESLSASMLVAIRRVIRAIDLHSKNLVQSHQLTGPQALVLRELTDQDGMTPSDIARRISLSQATITDIVKRLEGRGLLAREQDLGDRRRVRITLTAAGRRLQDKSPPLLQDKFASRFSLLDEWEQHMLLATMQRIAALMDAESLDAEPLLSSDILDNGVHAREDEETIVSQSRGRR